MKVAVFGSWPASGKNPEWQFFGNPQSFQIACRELGSALAAHGHTLIAESDNENVADRYVVDGYVQRAAAGVGTQPLIQLAWPRGEQRPFESHAQSHPAWFDYHNVPTPDPENSGWKSSHMRSLRLSEAVVTVAGMSGTYASGCAAILAKRPLAPVASFGGASARLLHDLNQESKDDGFASATSPLYSPWNPIVLDTALKLLAAPAATAGMALFISHAHADRELAAALVELVRGYFDVPSSAIRCTSVDGYTLPPGAQVSESLRSEVENSEFVLALVTPNGVRSTYVLFELGAAWGLRGRAFPLLAHGFSQSNLPGPFAERNSLDLANPNHCWDLLKALEASRRMRKKDESPTLISSLVGKVVGAAQPRAGT